FNGNHETEDNEEESYIEMTINEIMNGYGNEFPGLIPLIREYVGNISLDAQTYCKVQQYIQLIADKSSAKLQTTAQWMRDFVRKHADYKYDSVCIRGARIQIEDLATVNGAGIDNIYGLYADCLRAREGIRFKRNRFNRRIPLASDARPDKEREAEKAIIEAFDFFHKERLHQLSDTFFPSEGFATGGMYRFGRSKFGQPLLGVVMNHIRPFGLRLAKDSLMKLTQKYCLYNVYRSLFDAKESNFIIYVVFTNTTLENTEFSLFQRTMMAINRYIAGAGAIKIYVVGMNKLMDVSLKLLVNLLKPTLKQRIHFIERMDQMEDLISLDEVQFKNTEQKYEKYSNEHRFHATGGRRE
ncbi:unnamed protein product, partial [Medioppia subpectinata]